MFPPPNSRQPRRLLGAALALQMAASAALAAGTGPYPAIMQEDPGLSGHTIYRPASLQPFGHRNRLPIVVWGNGGCANVGNASRALLTEVASHGYLVIASGPVREPTLPARPAPTATSAAPTAAAPPPVAASGAAAPRVGPPPGAPGTENLSTTAQLAAAIDWATREGRREGSAYRGRIATDRVAAMGASCGGLQAIEVGSDARVSTLIEWSSGTLDYPRAGANVTRADLQKVHGPILYVLGGSNDVATPFGQKDFAAIDQVPVFMATNEGAGHGGTLNNDNGGAWAPVGIAWLNWQLKGQLAAASYFKGADCRLCSDPAWKVEKKRID